MRDWWNSVSAQLGTLFDIEAFEMYGKLSDDCKSAELWAQNLRGELAMQATATLV